MVSKSSSVALLIPHSWLQPCFTMIRGCEAVRYNSAMENDDAVSPQNNDDDELIKHQERLAYLRARFYTAKIAYLNRTPFESKEEILYDDLKSIAQEFIRASYEYQKLKYGSIILRISVAKLLSSLFLRVP